MKTIITDKLVTMIAEELQIDEELAIRFIPYALDNVVLMNKKQKDYGPNNISEIGVKNMVVRMEDKIARIKHLLHKGCEAANELLEDSFQDISNYANIARMVNGGSWPSPTRGRRE